MVRYILSILQSIPKKAGYKKFLGDNYDEFMESFAELYRKYNLIDTLLPLTRSCEGWDYMTDGFTKECGECWWCMERSWAFREYHWPGDCGS